MRSLTTHTLYPRLPLILALTALLGAAVLWLTWPVVGKMIPQTIVVVCPTNLNGWVINNFDDATATATGAAQTTSGTQSGFAAGPGTPPLGVGSFREKIGTNGNDAARIVTSQFNGMALTAITALSYSTYVTAFGSGGQAPYIQLRIDKDNNGSTDDILFFEPVYQNGTYGLLAYSGPVPNQCGVNPNCVSTNTWQTWDAEIGGWWSVNDSAGGPPLTTLAGYATQYPGAKLATDTPSFRITSGFGAPAWNNFDGNADNLTVNGTTFDFEPTCPPPPPSPPVLTVLAGDPAVCLEPDGLVGVTATVTNPNNATLATSFTATLPTGLTAIAGTCSTDVNPAGCTIAANGGSLTWNGSLSANQTVTIIYRARIGATVPPGAQLCITITATVGGVATNPPPFCFSVICPAITNTRVSDQKAGSILVFPYYTSTIGGASDTRLTISNISNAAGTIANQTYVHLFIIDGTTCQQADLYLCLTPNASFSFKASDYDPGNTGYVIAVAVNAQGVPIQNNVLIGNAFVNTPEFADNYGAESFRANSFALATVSGNTATLFFDQVGYDALPKQFAVEIQSPLDAPGQQIVTSGLIGDLTIGPLVGAAQVGTGLAFNEQEKFVSFSNWLTGSCQVRATINSNSPRVPNGLGNLIKSGQAGHLKFNVRGAVGLLLTPRTAPWRGIRTLHKTQTSATSLTIPIFVPVC